MKKYLLVALSVFLTACANQAPTEPQAEDQPQAETTREPLQVAVTINPLHSLTTNLVEGADVDVSLIVPPNTSVHSFALTPSVAKDIETADLIVANGLELEEFLEDSLDGSDAMVVDTSEGVELLDMLEAGHGDHEEEEEEDEHGHDDHDDGHHEEEEEDHHDEEDDHGHHHHGEHDPHIWLSPENAIIQAANIVEALKEVDPDNAATYDSNFNELRDRLMELDEELTKGFNALTIEPYIVFHDAYQYFETRYGIESVAFLEEFPGKEPSAAYLAEVIEIIEENSVRVIFAEPQFSPKLVGTLSSDYELKTGELDPLGTSIGEDAYFEMMRSNLEAFKAVFN